MPLIDPHEQDLSVVRRDDVIDHHHRERLKVTSYTKVNEHQRFSLIVSATYIFIFSLVFTGRAYRMTSAVLSIVLPITLSVIVSSETYEEIAR